MIAILAFILATKIRAEPPLEPDKVHVTPELTSEHRDPKKSATEIVEKRLKLILSNHSNQEVKNAAIRIVFYATDVKKNTPVIEKTLEKTTSIEAGGQAKIIIDPVTFQYTPEHGSPVKAGQRRAVSKKIPASGHRYAGYSVQIVENGKIVGWISSGRQFDPSLKKDPAPEK